MFKKKATAAQGWLGIAAAQWELRALERDVAKRARTAAPATPEGKAFLAALRRPPAKARPRRNRKRNLPPYGPGVCLAVRLPDGDWSAAIVLAARRSHNLVDELDHKSAVRPTRKVFERRKWLILSHHSWGKARHTMWCWSPPPGRNVEVVCKVALRPDDPVDSNCFGGWCLGLQVMLQRKWDAGDRS